MASRMAAVLRKVILTPNSPKPVGPYSQAIVADRTIYVSGQLGLDPKTSQFAGDDITSQTHQCLKNVQNILESAQSSLEKVVKVSVYLADIKDYPEMNKVYAEFFKTGMPARVAFQAGGLPLNARVEIDAIALVGDVTPVDAQSNL